MVVMEVCRKFDALYAPIFKVFLVSFLKDVLPSALLRRFDSYFALRKRISLGRN